MSAELDRIFADTAIRTLRQLSERIAACLDKLTDEQIWFRAAGHENAVGNLVLHLCGNVHQWIGHGVGGRPDIRMRDREFDARGDVPPAELKERLRTTIDEAAAVLEKVDAAGLARRVDIQNYDVTCLEAVFHSVQHFGQHTGQIVFITKNLAGEDLGFYRHLSRPGHGEKTP